MKLRGLALLLVLLGLMSCENLVSVEDRTTYDAEFVEANNKPKHPEGAKHGTPTTPVVQASTGGGNGTPDPDDED